MPEKRKIITEIEELLQLKEEIRITMEQIVEQCVSSDDQKVRVLNSRADPQDFDCYTKAARTFSKTCYDLGQVNLSSFCSKMMIMMMTISDCLQCIWSAVTPGIICAICMPWNFTECCATSCTKNYPVWRTCPWYEHVSFHDSFVTVNVAQSRIKFYCIHHFSLNNKNITRRVHKKMLHKGNFLTCVAIKFRNKLQEKLPSSVKREMFCPFPSVMKFLQWPITPWNLCTWRCGYSFIDFWCYICTSL